MQRTMIAVAVAASFCTALPSFTRAQTTQTTQAAHGTSAGSRAQSQAAADPQVERQRQQAEQSARRTLDQDAMVAIQETERAIQALAAGRTDEALAAIERATGKINVVTARNPAAALLPVDAEVVVIDAAPTDPKEIRRVGKAAEEAVENRDFPSARVLLERLVSEIRVRTYNLPLATYPVAMRDATRLIEQKKTQEAQLILQTALNTLAIVDHVTPLPIATAEAAVIEAQGMRDRDKEGAKRLLAVAKQELHRARELGYAGHDPEYAQLDQAISNVEKALDGNKDSGSAFAKLKEKVSSFFHRQSETERRSEVASR
jgi:tetratricopeptide (TPR) repeat protein